MKRIIALAMITIFIFSLIPLAFADDLQVSAATGQYCCSSFDESTGKTKTFWSEDKNCGISEGVSCAGSCPNVVDSGRCPATTATTNTGETKDDQTRTKTEIKAKAEERRKGNLERLKILREEGRIKIEALDSEKLDRISNLSRERLQKIAELDKRQIERLASLNIKNLDKIAELKKERLEKIAKLSEEKIKRLAELEKEKLEKISDLNETEIEKFSTLNRARLKELAKFDKEKLKAELKALKVLKVKNADDLNRRDIPEARLAQLREGFDKAKEEFKEARDELKDARDKLKEARDRKDEKATLEQAKNYLLHTADALIKHLEKIKAKVQESENIQDDREAKIVAEIDAQIAEINQIKADIEAATTKEQIKEAAKKLHDKWKRLKHIIRVHAERVVLARVEGIVNRGIVLEKRLDNVLEKAKEKGIEVDVSAEVAAFSEKIALAKDKYKQAQDKLYTALDLKASNSTEEQIKTAADEAKALLKEARDAIKEAHDILKTIVKKIKGAEPEADLSEEVEVEVAQETTASAT